MDSGTSPADPAASADASSTGPESGPETGPESGSAHGSGEARSSAAAGSSEGAEAASDASEASEASGASEEAGADGGTAASASSRRFPSLTRGTARPEGGGRAAPGDAPAPARQWPLLTVLCTAGAGLLVVAADPFDEAFRVGVMLMGIALLTGGVMRWVVPSVGMLAVRSRFTDLVTYGLMGALIVLFALMAQPKPWLDVPFLESAVRFTIR